MTDNVARDSGIGVFGVVFLVILTLKLTGTKPVSELSWWWIALPFWGIPALLASVLLCIAVVTGLIGLWDWMRGRRGD